MSDIMSMFGDMFGGGFGDLFGGVVVAAAVVGVVDPT